MNSKPVSSRVRDYIKFLTSVQGDLSNITAPPFFLAPSSVVEVGRCWAQHPKIFAAPALEPCPEKRSLLVLRHFLSALRSQLYIAGSPTVSIKKPLNAFLGELFLASWTDPETKAKTRLISEQVSHHPPITAMHISDAENGIRADGYARVEMTFNTTVEVRQVGHAVIHIDKYDEDYIVPLPTVKVRGLLTGKQYPEINETYTILSSSGFVSEIKFTGGGMFWGTKNGFEARMYRKDDAAKTSIYEASGVWSEAWTVKDCRTGEVVESFDLDAPENAPAPIELPPVSEQDPWESRRAWAGVRSALEVNDFGETVKAKSKVEKAQRAQRATEKAEGRVWKPLFFDNKPGPEHQIFHELTEGTNVRLHDDRTKGVWRVMDDRINTQRPFRGNTCPTDG